MTERAEPLDFSEQSWQMKAPSLVLTIPEHIRLTASGGDRIWKTPPVNRREVLRRDGEASPAENRHTCQYCGSKKQLTLDHVIPKAWGGQHTWDNVVAACSPCNSKKGPDRQNSPICNWHKNPKHPCTQSSPSQSNSEKSTNPKRVSPSARDLTKNITHGGR